MFDPKNIAMSEAKLTPQPYTFPASHWHNIFQLLGLMMVSNSRVVMEDMVAYVNSAMELAAVVDPHIMITRQMAKDWYLLNKDELIEIVDSLAYDTAIINILNDIQSFPHKLDVIHCMVQIAIADNDYGPMEKTFIQKTILYWDISPTSEDITLSAPVRQAMALTA